MRAITLLTQPPGRAGVRSSLADYLRAPTRQPSAPPARASSRCPAAILRAAAGECRSGRCSLKSLTPTMHPQQACSPTFDMVDDCPAAAGASRYDRHDRHWRPAASGAAGGAGGIKSVGRCSVALAGAAGGGQMMESKAALLSLLLGALGCWTSPVAGDTVRADRCPQWLGTGAAQRPPTQPRPCRLTMPAYADWLCRRSSTM